MTASGGSYSKAGVVALHVVGVVRDGRELLLGGEVVCLGEAVEGGDFPENFRALCVIGFPVVVLGLEAH